MSGGGGTEVPCPRVGLGLGPELGGAACTVRSNALWVMVTCEPQTDTSESITFP